LATDLSKVKQHKRSLGRFILATNQLDSQQLTDAAVLSQYKEQANVEAGFKFIKDNAFELDSLFLKTPERIGALMMIMTLCLMVYNFAQYHLRQCLKDQDDVLPNQLGKPAQNPTLKWIAELMNVIAVVTLQSYPISSSELLPMSIKSIAKSLLTLDPLPCACRACHLIISRSLSTMLYKNLLHWCEK
jgi:transposase